MSPQEIREQIDKNNELIEKILVTNFFTLNKDVYELMKNNEKLQEKCEHKFVNGVCIYCDKDEI